VQFAGQLRLGGRQRQCSEIRGAIGYTTEIQATALAGLVKSAAHNLQSIGAAATLNRA